MGVKLYLVILWAYVICVSFTSCQHARRRMSMRVPAYFPLGPVAPTDGWESWSTWTKCSRTCGGGVQVRRRNCRQTLQRPTNINMNPWLCNGPNKLYKSCNLVPCPDGSVNTRRAQCSKYNSRLFAGNSYVWEPLSRGGPCELSCKARGHRFFVRHSDQVTDGTDCSYLELPGSRKKSGEGSRKSVRRVCVEGRCMTTGCDGIMGSRLTLDNCGLCGGDGTSCTVGHGIFRNEALTNDFHLVVTIPVGSTRINITERAQSRSFLALRSRPSGHFFINGKLAKGSPDPSHSYRAAGTFFVYDRPFQSTKGESIWAEGPTNEDIDVLIYFQRENPGIEYDYIVPRATAPPSVGSTNLDHNRDGRLDQRVDTEALDGLDRSYPSAASANSVFNHPPLRRNYYNSYENVNPHPYPPFRQGSRFHPGPQSLDATQKRDLVEISREDRNNIGLTNWENQGFSPCSRSCAGGIKQTIIRCVSTESRAPVEDRYCDADSKPTVRKRRCNRQSCPAFYDVGPWSDCSRTCGYGRRTRKVVCKQQFPGNFTAVVSHKKCRGRARPRPQERCRMRECARWEVVGEWSQCSANCGSGTQTRMIACKLGNGRVMPDGLCPAARRPTPTKSCDAGPCLTGWYVTDWQECSADCDRGIQRRNVFCINTAQSVTGCPSPTEPNSTRSCARNSCGTKYEWFAGQWGTCSSKCGNGVQERKVTCLSVTPEGAMAVAELVDGRTQCDVREKPATEQACNTQACGSRWHYTPWTECSVSCGGGSRTRDVQCLDENRHFSSLCNIAEKPKDAERCNTVSCHSLQDPNCQDELPNCKTVLQARFCGYDFYRKKCCHTCSNGRGAPYRQR